MRASAALPVIVTIRVRGTFEGTYALEICDEVVEVCCAGELHLVVDFSGCHHAHFGALRGLAARRRFVTDAGGVLDLAGVSLYIRTIAAAVGLLGPLGLETATPGVASVGDEHALP